MRCDLMKILSYASAKKKTQMLKRFKFFVLVWVVLNWHHGYEGVKGHTERRKKRPGGRREKGRREETKIVDMQRKKLGGFTDI